MYVYFPSLSPPRYPGDAAAAGRPTYVWRVADTGQGFCKWSIFVCFLKTIIIFYFFYIVLSIDDTHIFAGVDAEMPLFILFKNYFIGFPTFY